MDKTFHGGTETGLMYENFGAGGVTIGCSNGGLSITYSYEEYSSLVGKHVEAPNPPPPPSCSYISSYSFGSWSTCSVNGQWSAYGQASCHQTRGASANYTTLGQDSCPSDAAYPDVSELNRDVSLNLGIDNSSSTCTSKIANNIDSCQIKVNVNGVPSE